jgi:hypothetical protein
MANSGNDRLGYEFDAGVTFKAPFGVIHQFPRGTTDTMIGRPESDGARDAEDANQERQFRPKMSRA